MTPSTMPRSTARSVSDIIDLIRDCRQNAALLAYSAPSRNCKKRKRRHIGRMNRNATGHTNQHDTTLDNATGALIRGPGNAVSRMPPRRPTAYTFPDHALMVRFATATLRRYRDDAAARTDG
ncbi:hypothetical protein S58_01450 [Bradyrhizobium oligotrophicum S58]|uniref:Uncharacterized protein n=1 Tax=Bradyrhizobium oligotrophicum S58 TaxID=1245469 RepID=M4Z047_9BRAD|nr:hypothetical protein S58_01450 [Bradyrhizobium oligotrophicum S58]